MQLADPFYYLRNFEAMIGTLAVRDADLLAPDERDFLGGFVRLPLASRALLVRMFMRKGPLFRASRLRYSEIAAVADLESTVQPLVAACWIDARPQVCLDELFRLYAKAALIELLGVPRKQAALSKALLLERLRLTHDGAVSLEAAHERIYRLEVKPLCDRLRLMFFGNFGQDMTEFVLADLQVFKYEKVVLHADSRPFRTRRQVDDFHRLYECRQMLRDGADLATIEAALPAPIVDCDWLEERRQKLLFQLARACERQGLTDRARGMLATCTHPQAGQRSRRLEDRAQGIAQRRVRRAAHPEFALKLDKSLAGERSVERFVLDTLAAGDEETHVRYVENALVNSLFGLLCWTAVFAPVRGAFFHAFHHGPADLTSTHFFARRAAQFERCLAELRGGGYKSVMRRCYVEKAGISSPFVAWGLLDAALLEVALECLPAWHLELWFRWMLRDMANNRSGFPDLVQFWPHSKRYRLIEVKAPGDRLQDNQRRWFDFCGMHDLPVSVCRVIWSDRRTAHDDQPQDAQPQDAQPQDVQLRSAAMMPANPMNTPPVRRLNMLRTVSRSR